MLLFVAMAVADTVLFRGPSPEGDFQVGVLDMERPAFGRSVIGRIDETHHSARSREFFRRGEWS